jgi:mannose/fructose/N-acetylgalactosamine-specific phosphotransferase system component IIC
MSAFTPALLVWLSLLGGLVATDSTSFGQFMLSRPLVAATLAGWIVGDPKAGAAIGLILEAFQLGVLPVGAARYPEAGPAAVVAGAVYAMGPTTPSAMLLVVAFTLVWERLSGQTVHHLRHLNVRIVASGGIHGPADLQRRHLAATGVDFLRGVLLVIVGALLLAPALRLITPLWGLDDRITGLVLGGMLVALLASSFRLFAGRIPWFAVGLAGGLVLVLATT